MEPLSLEHVFAGVFWVISSKNSYLHRLNKLVQQISCLFSLIRFNDEVSHSYFDNFPQLLDAVSRMASLGFEKSYRETVVLMTRSYLNKLSSVGSAESKTVAPEATTERVEVSIDLEI